MAKDLKLGDTFCAKDANGNIMQYTVAKVVKTKHDDGDHTHYYVNEDHCVVVKDVDVIPSDYWTPLKLHELRALYMDHAYHQNSSNEFINNVIKLIKEGKL